MREWFGAAEAWERLADGRCLKARLLGAGSVVSFGIEGRAGWVREDFLPFFAQTIFAEEVRHG